ncbi:hypothetical protein C9374_013594 [Naegleria lovaniensis]|uniref:DUF4116 domain-containing protein n=1 Tax=Naegleria lovaniensis TaxID=51637 RepID=A0AA88KQT8_NAELO|nr:uncharacterized protein C9374_013594 [Naegleria lovaniensis]KAG2392109.1 hypothetical protein C9374_013594 [Naegleria lovaniensis]
MSPKTTIRFSDTTSALVWISQNGSQLQNISDYLRDDPEIVKAALLNHLNAFHFMSKRLKLDRDMCHFVFQLVDNYMKSNDPKQVQFIQQDFLPKMNITSKHFLQVLLKEYPELFEFLPEKFYSSFSLSLLVVKRKASMIQRVKTNTWYFHKILTHAYSTDYYETNRFEWINQEIIEKSMKPYALKQAFVMKNKLLSYCSELRNDHMASFSDISIVSMCEKQVYDFHFYYKNQ